MPIEAFNDEVDIMFVYDMLNAWATVDEKFVDITVNTPVWYVASGCNATGHDRGVQ